MFVTDMSLNWTQRTTQSITMLLATYCYTFLTFVQCNENENNKFNKLNLCF